MSVWVCVPSARPVAEVREWAAKWHERGYKVALWRDFLDMHDGTVLLVTGEYPGYAQATNKLIDYVLRVDPHCDWVCAGGDDVSPDPNHTADEIAAQCSEHFAKLNAGPDAAPGVALSTRSLKAALNGIDNHTFGVMQPTGDPWGETESWAIKSLPVGRRRSIERICGSPWLGREYCRRVNGGRGPLWPEYFHNWVDEECQEVAIKLGVFWQRPDLTHYHDNPLRHGKPRPTHLSGVDAEYVRTKPLFDRRKARGFPGHEVIA